MIKGRQNAKYKQTTANKKKPINFDALNPTCRVTLGKFLTYLSLYFVNLENEQ